MYADGAPTEDTAAWTKWVHRAAITLAASLVVAGVLLALVEFGAIEGPGAPPGAPNDYPIQLGYHFADEQVIFPYQVAGGLLFSLGFLAFAVIGLGLRSLAARANPARTIVAGCFAFGAGLLVISQLIFIGAKRVAIDTVLCDCRWASDQLISQHRALAMVESVSDWLIAGIATIPRPASSSEPGARRTGPDALRSLGAGVAGARDRVLCRRACHRVRAGRLGADRRRWKRPAAAGVGAVARSATCTFHGAVPASCRSTHRGAAVTL